MKYFLMFSTMAAMALPVFGQIKYPETAKQNVTDIYAGSVKIEDPYRWLENDTAAEVEKWVKAQNTVTQGYLSGIPYRDRIKERLTETWNYPRYSAPFRKGEYYFYSYNDGLKNQSVMYYQKGLKGEPQVFLDPNTLSSDGTVSLSGLYFSKDNRYCAYMISKSGSDWQELFVMEVSSRKLMSDRLNWIKFSNAAWYEDGFYYSRYPEPTAGLEFSSASQSQKIYYHKLGESQSQDLLIYEDPEHPKRYMSPIVSDDGKFLFISLSEGTSGSAYLISSPQGKKPTAFKPFLPGFKNNYGIVENIGNQILVRTDLNAGNYRLVMVDPENPAPENWKDIIPESESLLSGVSYTGGKIFASYLKDVTGRVYQFDVNGKKEKEIPMPGVGSVGGFGGEKDDQEIFYTFSNFIQPPQIYRYDILSGESTLFRKLDYPVDLQQFVSKQVFYKSKDGTLIPMFIMHKKGIELNGNNPTLLYAYGGFNISLTPSFSPSNIVFIENGGIYCVANLRGGGEYGEKWHQAGMLTNKQNVFDDFIAAAEYLIAEKYTNPQKLAISGRSNGGLLVGACMTQRPDLFKVALPGVGVLDMLRYHKFTVGWGWVVEYGSSDQPEAFHNLIKYSPLHNLKKGTKDPATLITTADHDDRVVPAHSFKFAATLQEMHQGSAPVLIRIDEKAGHGAGKPISKTIDELTDVWSFVFYNLGMTVNR
jgi:prolyl oligopeptidase